LANVYTGGTFDLFHEGHIELLEACKRMAGPHGKVVVALNTDEFIERFKHRKPVQSYREREKMLRSCKYVDHVVANIGEEDSTLTIEGWNKNFSQVFGDIDIVAIGSDWAGRDYYGQMGFTKEWLDKHNIILAYIDRRTGQSTTNLKNVLKEY
jgi:glycerol-3-phosphate cytidylyltransferase